jgi:hypothetical protein
MFLFALAFLLGAAVSFAVTRLANHLNGTDALKADFDLLKARYADALSRLNAVTTPATPPTTPSA